MLLDTTFFINLEEEIRMRRPGACSAFLRTHRNVTKNVSVVTIGEFAIGAVSAATTLRFFRGYQRLALGRDIAIFSGRLQASLPFELGENDRWIAGTTRYHRLPIVTRDGVFARIPGVKIVRY